MAPDNEPLIAVDPQIETPPYQQIFEQIRAAIERGTLAPDAPLPTVRQLAGDLGVAPNTVARAYADLQDAGWLVSEGGAVRVWQARHPRPIAAPGRMPSPMPRDDS